jgi:nicotinate-nucleotide adenylyltransferase
MDPVSLRRPVARIARPAMSHATREALRRLRLDKVVWLVSPQNPLKTRSGMASFADRFASARRVAAADPRIEVSDYEEQKNLRFSVDTITGLARDPSRRHVWIIGADNLIQLPRWKHWLRLFHACPVAVIARAPYLERAGLGLVARRFAGARLDERQAHVLADLSPPAWVLLHHPLHPASSTAIRLRAEAAWQERSK